MNNKSVMFSVLAFSLVVALACGAFLAAFVTTSANGADMAYSLDKSVAFKVVSYMYIVCLVAFLALTFVFKDKFSKKLKTDSVAFKISSGIGAFLSAFIAVYGTYAMFSGSPLLQEPTPKIGVYIPNICFILALLGTAVYFAFSAFSKTDKYANAFGFMSLLLPVALIIKLICDFLVQNTNGFSKLYNFHLLAIAFFLLFAINESRVYMRKSAPALYVFFGVAGSIAALIYAIPSLFLIANNASEQSGITAMIYCVVDIFMVVAVYIRLFSLGVKEPNVRDVINDPTVVFNEDGQN